MTNNVRSSYLELLKRALRGELSAQKQALPTPAELEESRLLLEKSRTALRPHITDQFPMAAMMLELGPMEWWFIASRNRNEGVTLCPREGLDNVQMCVETVLRDGVPGDLLEAGCYRGGQGILMRGLLRAHGDDSRHVWLADSFEGLPTPDPRVDVDDAVAHAMLEPVQHFRVTEEEVRANFARFDLLDDRVHIAKGWFKDTLPRIEAKAFSVLRLDGDYYSSTVDALNALYDKLSPGGFLILDDYGLPIGCKRATDEFREKRGIHTPITMVNQAIAFWRKEA